MKIPKITKINMIIILSLILIGTIVNATPVENEDNRFSFTGKELDITGLYYFGARYYDAEQIGRFISPDPVNGKMGDLQNLNKYSYCLNNPLIYTDPDGQQAVYAPHGRKQIIGKGEFITYIDARHVGNPGQPFSEHEGVGWSKLLGIGKKNIEHGVFSKRDFLGLGKHRIVAVIRIDIEKYQESGGIITRGRLSTSKMTKYNFKEVIHLDILNENDLKKIEELRNLKYETSLKWWEKEATEKLWGIYNVETTPSNIKYNYLNQELDLVDYLGMGDLEWNERKDIHYGTYGPWQTRSLNEW